MSNFADDSPIFDSAIGLKSTSTVSFGFWSRMPLNTPSLSFWDGL